MNCWDEAACNSKSQLTSAGQDVCSHGHRFFTYAYLNILVVYAGTPGKSTNAWEMCLHLSLEAFGELELPSDKLTKVI